MAYDVMLWLHSGERDWLQLRARKQKLELKELWGRGRGCNDVIWEIVWCAHGTITPNHCCSCFVRSLDAVHLYFSQTAAVRVMACDRPWSLSTHWHGLERRPSPPGAGEAPPLHSHSIVEQSVQVYSNAIAYPIVTNTRLNIRRPPRSTVTPPVHQFYLACSFSLELLFLWSLLLMVGRWFTSRN